MNESQMIQIVERFSRRIEPVDGQVKVLQIPDYKTVYIEQVGEAGRSMILSEYQVDGKTYWAGYSPISQTVYVSKASRD